MITRYVDTASAGGDGTTELLTGPNAAFTFRRDALVALGSGALSDEHTIWFKASTGLADTLSATQAHWDFQTSPTNKVNLIVHPDHRHTGKYNTSKYRVEVTNEDAMYSNIPSHVWITGFQTQITVTDSGEEYRCYRLSTANNATDNTDHRYDKCIAKIVRSGGTSTVYGWHESASGVGPWTGTCRMFSCLVQGASFGFSSDGSTWSETNIRAYNCTGYGCGRNFENTMIRVNCLGAAFTDFGDFSEPGVAGNSHNASSDDTADGTSARINQTFSFVDAGGGDFRLQSTDAGAKGFGLDDPLSGLYLDDLAGNTRPVGAWSIGALEAVTPTAAVTGTATAGINEGDIVAGGKTIIVTLTDDTFVSNTGFPTVETTAESSVNTAGTSHTVTLPAGMVASDLILITMDIGSTSATLNALANWSELLDEAAANGLKILYYSGAGVPSNPTFTSSASTRSASIAWRISGADKTIAPQIGTTGTGTSATPDPPASATPSSTKNYLFIAFYGAAGEEADDDTWSDTPPTNYGPTPPLQKACGTAGTNLGGLIAAAHRQLNTGSAENPGTFAKDVSAAWRSQTIMVHPALLFDAARQAFIDGIDSAQSEANGWDAKRSGISVTAVARTSDNVATLTLPALATYNITAQEVLEHTIPASILTGGSAIVATPTFTIDPSGGGATSLPPVSARHPMAHLLVR